MATNLQLDDDLVRKAVRLGQHRTKRAAVNRALEEYVRHLEQLKIVSLFGKVDYVKGYDHKKLRGR